MVGIITSGFGLAKAYTTEDHSSKVDNIIKDLEAKLPSMSPLDQQETAKRIAAMKTAARTNALKDSAANTGIEVAKFAVGKVGGPVGSAVATYIFHDTQQSIKSRKSEKIGKAEMIGGRRIARKCKQTKPEKTSAVAAAAKAGLTSVAVAASGITSIAGRGAAWAFNAGKSWLFG